jgi:hypothetical protein
MSKNHKQLEHNEEILLTRGQLAERWGCCKETIKRLQNRGQLPAIMFNGKNIRYALSDIINMEQDSRYCATDIGKEVNRV